MRGPQRGAGVALVGVQARDLLFPFAFAFSGAIKSGREALSS